ncbi:MULTISPECIES: hypothetical protein [Pandoraea]|uniref:Uncharacterized protein n=1 Tax=Pandoraea commovens TaxID=2508289 RepID=A0A5E4SEI2_9BURK|nr:MULTISPECIES: hypothetical protein [Pandoraea]VVD74306.1 hypothetical protein PCO31010_00789 [Pandoraea commovens]
MSQGSLKIPTTGTLSGLALVQAINAALANLAGMATGPTDPSSLPGGVEANSLWFDTSVNPGVLRQRNAANTSWTGMSIAPATLPQHAVQFSQVSGVVGQSRNAAITVPAATTTVTYTADELIVESALGGLRYCLANVNQSINIATTGAGGMASGSAPLNGFVAVYAQYNPTANTRTLVGVDASSAPVAETFAYAGFSASALVGFLPTNGSGQVIAGTNIVGRWVSRPVATILSANTPQATFFALSFAGAAPRNAKRVKLMLSAGNTAAPTTQTIDVASDSNISGQQSFAATTNLSSIGSTGTAQLDVVNTPNIFYRTQYTPVTGTPTFNIYLTGFEF